MLVSYLFNHGTTWYAATEEMFVASRLSEEELKTVISLQLKQTKKHWRALEAANVIILTVGVGNEC